MLKLIWFAPPVLHSAALHFGLLDTANVCLQADATSSSDEQIEGLLRGAYDASVTSLDNVVMWRRRMGGKSLRIVAQLEQTIALDVVARPGLTTLQDLRAGRLLVDSADNGFVVLLHKLLVDSGVDYDNCTIVQSGGVVQRLEALIEGKGDATILGPPFTAMALARGMVRLAELKAFFPGLAGQGLIARNDMPLHTREEFGRYLAALEQARILCRRAPEATVQRLTAAGGAEPLIRILVDSVGDTLVPDPGGIAMLTEQRRSLGRPGGEDAYESLVDRRFLEDARPSIAD